MWHLWVYQINLWVVQLYIWRIKVCKSHFLLLYSIALSQVIMSPRELKWSSRCLTCKNCTEYNSQVTIKRGPEGNRGERELLARKVKGKQSTKSKKFQSSKRIETRLDLTLDSTANPKQRCSSSTCIHNPLYFRLAACGKIVQFDQSDFSHGDFQWTHTDTHLKADGSSSLTCHCVFRVNEWMNKTFTSTEKGTHVNCSFKLSLEKEKNQLNLHTHRQWWLWTDHPNQPRRWPVPLWIWQMNLSCANEWHI